VVSASEGAAERVTLTADDATMPAVEGIVAILHAQGFVVERRVFVRAPAEETRRVVLLALTRPLPALVPLVAPPTALPGLGQALVAALYPVPERDPPDAVVPLPAALATLQLKAEGAFASLSARTGPELMDALLVLAGQVRRAAWVVRLSANRERRIVYLDGKWFSE